MPGIETNADQLAWLIAQIETKALKGAAAPGARIRPTGDELAGLMPDIVLSHLGDERTHFRAICLEPLVVEHMKPDKAAEQQQERAGQRQIEQDDWSHGLLSFLSAPLMEWIALLFPGIL